MGLHEWVSGLFNTASFRNDADYSREVPNAAKLGVLLYYRDFVRGSQSHFGGFVMDDGRIRWLQEVLRQMSHAHLEINVILRGRACDEVDPLFVLEKYLMDTRTPSSHFLDFLELSLGPGHLQPSQDNDFVNGLNVLLNQHGSDYLLTTYAVKVENASSGIYSTSVTAYPRAYLKQSDVVQETAIEPVMELLSDPAYKVPNDDFRKAMDRQRDGDWDGVLTACAATVEGALEVSAQNRNWKLKGNGVVSKFDSFASKSTTIPKQFTKVVGFLQDRRSTVGDAHGHAVKEPITPEEASFAIALSASLTLYVVNAS